MSYCSFNPNAPAGSDQRCLADGTLIIRTKHPMGQGYMYFIDGGKEGMVLAWDSFMVHPSAIATCLAWELDGVEVSEASPELKHVFNRKNRKYQYDSRY